MSGCDGIKVYVQGPCAVCELLDKDKTIKEVAWCNMCSVHICKPCNTNWIKRVEAFLKKRIIKYLG